MEDILTSSQLRVKSVIVNPGSDSGGVNVPRKDEIVKFSRNYQVVLIRNCCQVDL